MSAPRHHTPERSGWPSAVCGAFCWAGAAMDHTSVPAIAAVNIEYFISLLRFLRPEQTEYLPVRRHKLSEHPFFLRGVPRAKALDGDFGSRLDDIRLVTVANHAARRASLEGPLLG